MRKNDAFVAEIVNMRLTKTFMAIFAPDERLPSSDTLSSRNILRIMGRRKYVQANFET